MNTTFSTVIKFVFVGMIVIVFAAVAFVAGFGTSHLLTTSDLLPPSTSAPPTGLPTITPGAGESSPTPTPFAPPTPASEDEEAFQVFWEVWNLVQRNYYGELPDMQTVTYAAIRGMIRTLEDDYTAFLEPEISEVLAEDDTGEFEGIGAFVDLDEQGRVELVGIFEGGPAEGAGLMTGDRVVEVDGVSVIGKTLYEAIDLIRGPAGSEVVLLVEREDEPETFAVTVTRARLEIPIIEVEMLDNDIGYIRLYEFSATATGRVEEALDELLDEQPQGIVFDLRNNPGGWLDQAINVADVFLDDGVIVIQRWSDGRDQRAEAKPGDAGEDVPLVVLVDRGSASASEIVAGALQDRERAILIGEPTFGKGSVQRTFKLSDGSELRVTNALWFTPNDKAISGQGLNPDIVVMWPEESLEPDEDPMLDRAIEYFLTGE